MLEQQGQKNIKIFYHHFDKEIFAEHSVSLLRSPRKFDTFRNNPPIVRINDHGERLITPEGSPFLSKNMKT